jgi:hypothetical protein
MRERKRKQQKQSPAPPHPKNQALKKTMGWILVVELFFLRADVGWPIGSEVWGENRAPAALEIALCICRAERDSPQRRDAKAWQG